MYRESPIDAGIPSTLRDHTEDANHHQVAAILKIIDEYIEFTPEDKRVYIKRQKALL